MVHPGSDDELTELSKGLSPKFSDNFDAFVSSGLSSISYTSPFQPSTPADTWTGWMAQSHGLPIVSQAGLDYARRSATDLPTPHPTLQHNARIISPPSVQRGTELPRARLSSQGAAHVKSPAISCERPRGERESSVNKAAASTGYTRPSPTPLPGGSMPSPRHRTSGQHSSASQRPQAQVESDNLVTTLQALDTRVSELESKLDDMNARLTPPERSLTDDALQSPTTQEGPDLGPERSDAQIVRPSGGHPSYNALPSVRAVDLVRKKEGEVPYKLPVKDHGSEGPSKKDSQFAPGLHYRPDPAVLTHHSNIQHYTVPSSSRDTPFAENTTDHYVYEAFGHADHHAAWMARQDVAQRAQIDDLQMRLRSQRQCLEYYHAQATSQHAAQAQAYSALEYWYNLQAMELRTAQDRVSNRERIKAAPSSRDNTTMEPRRDGRRQTLRDRTEDSASYLTRGLRASPFGNCNGPDSKVAQRRPHMAGRSIRNEYGCHGQQHGHWSPSLPQNQSGFAEAQSYPVTHPSTVVIDPSVPSFATAVHDTPRFMPATHIDLSNVALSYQPPELMLNFPYTREMVPHVAGLGSMLQYETGTASSGHENITDNRTVPHHAFRRRTSQASFEPRPSTRNLQPWVEDDDL
jgi:hypothetical protein